MAKLVTRKDILDLLQRWQGGELSHKAVQEWANERYGSRQWDTEDEMADLVLTELYCLHTNLITDEDIPHLRALLAVPSGQIGTASALNREHARSISLNQRRKALASDPLYAPHCKLAK
jgi:hypothetical protein